VEVTSDAAGAVGYGAFYGDEWFNGLWLQQQVDLSIAYKEFFPVAIAAVVWGPRWSNQHIMFRSDNEAVVASIQHTSRYTSQQFEHCTLNKGFLTRCVIAPDCKG